MGNSMFKEEREELSAIIPIKPESRNISKEYKILLFSPSERIINEETKKIK